MRNESNAMLSYRLVGPSPPSATNSTRGFSSRVVFRHPNDLSSFSSLQGVLAQCRNRLLSAFFRSHVEPGTNSTCPAFFFSPRDCVHGHTKHLPRAFRRAWWCRRPWVDRACFLAHQGRRACRQSARRGRRRRTLLGTLAPPCRWSKNETRGWWPGYGWRQNGVL